MAAIKEHTIPNFIKSYKEEDITFSSLHFKEVDIKSSGEKMAMLSDSILDKYRDVLAEYIETKTLSPVEFNKYKYNPKFLSYDLYKTTELWFLLLDINQLYSTTQFNINPLKVFNPAVMKVIQSIMNLEKPFIDKNISEVDKMINS